MSLFILEHRLLPKNDSMKRLILNTRANLTYHYLAFQFIKHKQLILIIHKDYFFYFMPSMWWVPSIINFLPKRMSWKLFWQLSLQLFKARWAPIPLPTAFTESKMWEKIWWNLLVHKWRKLKKHSKKVINYTVTFLLFFCITEILPRFILLQGFP